MERMEFQELQEEEDKETQVQRVPQGQDTQPQGHSSRRPSPGPNSSSSHTSQAPQRQLRPYGVPLSLPRDRCQTPYPSREEICLGTRSLVTGHAAASIGCEWSPTDLVSPSPPSPPPLPALRFSINHQPNGAKFSFPLFKSEGIYSC